MADFRRRHDNGNLFPTRREDTDVKNFNQVAANDYSRRITMAGTLEDYRKLPTWALVARLNGTSRKTKAMARAEINHRAKTGRHVRGKSTDDSMFVQATAPMAKMFLPPASTVEYSRGRVMIEFPASIIKTSNSIYVRKIKPRHPEIEHGMRGTLDIIRLRLTIPRYAKALADRTFFPEAPGFFF